MHNYQNFLMTDNSVVVIFSDRLVPIDMNNPLCEKIKNLLLKGNISEAVDTIDISTRLEKHTSGRFYMKDGVVMLDGETLPVALSNRLLQFIDANLPCEPLVNFWNNLKQNPSGESKKDLYGFLEHNGIPLTSDGCFIAYKRVKEDWKDVHSGKFDNSPGTIVKMGRDQVDADRNVTCSSGLHVAAFKYADGFYPNGILVEVKVNPMNVVSVPVDYNNEKMRVCEYEVIKQCGGERQEPLYDYVDDQLYNDVDPDDDFNDDGDDVGADDFMASSYGYCKECSGEWLRTDLSGGVCPECIEDSEKDEEELPPFEGDDNLNAVKDARGRLCIPSIVTKTMGLKPGDKMYVWTEHNSLTVYASWRKPNDKTVDSYSLYTVDKSGNVRISRSILEEAAIHNAIICYLSFFNDDNDLLTITG